MNKVKYAILSTGLCLLTLIANAQHPNWYPEPRPVEFHDFPEIGLRIATDAEPAWQVVLDQILPGNMQRLLPKVRRTIFRWRSCISCQCRTSEWKI